MNLQSFKSAATIGIRNWSIGCCYINLQIIKRYDKNNILIRADLNQDREVYSVIASDKKFSSFTECELETVFVCNG